ncbi:MAG: hypothetical protein M1281_20065 [Chloroflexi bacterium]|nr:hypothetical protein [Chloroflexota bacterium]
MTLVRKLRRDQDIRGIIPFLSILPIFGLASLFYGIRAGFIAIGIWSLLFLLVYLYVFVRTRNFAHLVICADAAFLGAVFLVFSPQFGAGSFPEIEFKAVYAAGILFFGILIFALVITRRLKWRGREILELAGEPVDEIGNGYTSRPRPVGKMDYTLEQIHGFARFAARNLIALPYITSKNITLVPIKMGEEYFRLLGLSGDYRDATWVNFDEDGEVSVHIAQKDYLEYREPLAFDQLCVSLGQVFIGFFELYKKGEGARFIDRMDDLRIPIFS